MQLFKQLGINIALLIVGFFSIAQARDTGVVSYNDRGHANYHNRRPSGGVTDYLPHAGDEILIRFKDTATSTAKSLAHSRHQSATIKRFRHVRNLELVKLPPGAAFEQALKTYRDNENVLYAEPNYLIEALAVPNDSSFPSQWNLRNTGQNGGTPGADIKAVQAWDITTGSTDVVIAVIDTGVDYTHQDLAANMWRNEADCDNNGVDDDHNGYSNDCYGINTFNDNSNPLDDNNHGTHVAGIIGAVGNNSVGVAGVNWNVKIMACKFMNASGVGTVSDAIECLQYVQMMKDRGVNIVATNNSWGAFSYSQALYDAIDAQRQSGILFIAAAGNSSGDNDPIPFYPASYNLPNIISVAATDRADHLASFSDYGNTTVHLGAPGVEISSTIRGNNYSTMSGTSMATPHVTGLAALLKAQDPNRDWRAIKNLILAGGDTRSTLNNTITQRRLNAFGSLTCSNSTVAARLLPTANSIVMNMSNIDPIALAALHIRCASPDGDVGIVVNPGGQVVTLRDDGLGTDQNAGDGIYSGLWTPPGAGTFTLNFPDGDVVTVQVIGSDAVPPDTNITSGPVGTITVNNATFSWTGSDDVTTSANLVYAYRLFPIAANFSAFSSLTSTTYNNLANANYTFFVKSRDEAGNEDPTPASRQFTVNVPPVISLTYDGQLRDRVGQSELALAADGRLDGVFAVTLNTGSGGINRTVTRLHLTNNRGGVWNTQAGDGFWSLGAANDLDTTLLNNVANDSVSFALSDGGVFRIFAADFQNVMYIAGTLFTLTANFSDGSAATANVTIPIDIIPPMNVQVTAPTSGQTVSGSFSFRGSAQDNSGTIQRMEFYTDSDPSPSCIDAIAKASGSMFQCNWNTSSKTNGSHAVRARAYDANNNFSDSASVAFSVNNNSLSPTIGLAFDGQLRDKVGQNESASNPDGKMDGVFTVTLNAGSGNRTVTRLHLTNTAGGIWNTQAGDGFWTLGAAAGLDTLLLNAANDSVNFLVNEGSSFKIFAADFQNLMFVNATSFTLTVNFADGSASTGSVTINTAALPTVTIAATAPTASEGGGAGVFTVTRTGSTNSGLLVYYTITGTATNGQDYQMLPSSVTIPSGQSSAIISVTPVDDSAIENSETVILTLTPDASYTVGSSGSATVTIVDNDSQTACSPSIALGYDGAIRDRVGQGELALTPDGQADGVFSALFTGSGNNCVVMRLELNRTGLVGVWDTVPNDQFWILGAANGLDTGLINANDGSVNISLLGGNSFKMFAADYASAPAGFPNGLFIPGSTFSLKATFSNGVTTTSSVTINSTFSGPTISLSYDGKIRDRVGQSELALNSDGQLDGVFSVTLNAGSGNRTVNRLQLSRLGAVGIWDTQAGDGYWSLGVANTLDTNLLNAANDAVNFQLSEGNTFKLFASDYQGQLFVPGSSFTLSVDFSDGATAIQSVTIP